MLSNGMMQASFVNFYFTDLRSNVGRDTQGPSENSHLRIHVPKMLKVPDSVPGKPGTLSTSPMGGNKTIASSLLPPQVHVNRTLGD